jgi:hypothetical protein
MLWIWAVLPMFRRYGAPPSSGLRCLGFLNLYANISKETTGEAEAAMPSRQTGRVDREIYESTVHPTDFYPDNRSC